LHAIEFNERSQLTKRRCAALTQCRGCATELAAGKRTLLEKEQLHVAAIERIGAAAGLFLMIATETVGSRDVSTGRSEWLIEALAGRRTQS
jgi:hypothetical protein